MASPLRSTAIPGLEVAEFGGPPETPVPPARPAPVYGPGGPSPLRATAIPGIETAEFGGPPPAQVPPGRPLPMAGSAPTMTAPGNPNVGAGGSADAQAFRASRLAPADAGPLRGRINAMAGGEGAAYSAGRSIGAGLRAAGPAMAVAGGALGAADGFQTDTEQYAKRFGLENTQPGLARDLGVRALGVASDVGNNLLLGAPAALGAFRDRNEQPAAAAPAAPTATSAQPASWSSEGLRAGAPAIGAPTSNVPGAPDIVREGNTYSSISDPGAGSVSTIGGGAESVGRNLRAAAIYKSMQPENGSSYIPGVNAPQTQYEQELAARNASVRSTTGSTGGEAGRRERMLDIQNREAGARERSNDVAMAGHEMGLRGQLAGVDASREGHQLSYDAAVQGHNAVQATARARLSYDMNKDNRDFGLRAAEFGQTQTKNAYEQNKGAEEQLQKNLESRFRTRDEKGNDVPDGAKIADFRQAATSTIPALAKELEATGNPAAIAKAADLRKRGPAALEPGDVDAMHQLYQTRDRLAAARGFAPNQGTMVDSHNLLDYRQKPGAAGVEQRTFGGNRVNFAGGASASVNDLRYADGPANEFIPDVFKVRSNDLTRGLRSQ